MKVEKKVLNEALRVLGKVVCQTSPVELYQSVRFVGNADGENTEALLKACGYFMDNFVAYRCCYLLHNLQ